MKSIAAISISQTADGRFFANVSVNGKEYVTDDQRSVHLTLLRVERVLERAEPAK